MRHIVSRRHALTALCQAPLLLALAACGHAATAVSTVAPTAGTTALPPPPTATAPPPASTPMPTSTSPAATVTATAPAATATASPTPPPTATSAPTSTATPSAQATADAISAKFPGSGWDFRLRPLLFQIDNAPEARPQSGMSGAYAVYETPAEGGITRFSAVFVQQALPAIGNLRSGRLVDLELTPQWDGVLLHVGASTPVEQLLTTAGLTQLDLDLGTNKPAAWRSSDRVAPYNLYTSMDRLRPFLQSKGIPLVARQPRAFPVGPLPPQVMGTPALELTVPYDAPSTAVYSWDARVGGYQRTVNGESQFDAVTGRQIVVANAVLHLARQEVTDIIEDEEGSHSLRFQLQGTGKALLLRDGQRFELTWRRDKADTLTSYVFADGTPAAFAPGNVWIAILSDTVSLPGR